MQDDGSTEGRCQRYRAAPAALRAALQRLQAATPPLTAVLSLGDIIDGAPTEAQSRADLELIAGIYDATLQVREGGGPPPGSLGCVAQNSNPLTLLVCPYTLVCPQVPVHHVVGNHCLAVPREALLARLGIPAPGYYTVPLPHAWRLVVLDTTELSAHSGHPAGSPEAEEAAAYWGAHPLSEAEPQMVAWNGGATRRQLAWLASTLQAAEAAGERVVVASHHPVGGSAAGSARATHLAWNWREVEALLAASPAVRLALAGHDHVGGYGSLGGGTHFVTVQAILEAPSEEASAWAVLEVCADRIELRGGGSVPSRTLLLL